MTHPVIRLWFTVASLFSLGAGLWLMQFGLFFGGGEGVVVCTISIELLLAAIYLARRSQLIWVYAFVAVVEGLFATIVGLLSAFAVGDWDEGWFHLFVVGLILANTLIVLRFLLPPRPERGSCGSTNSNCCLAFGCFACALHKKIAIPSPTLDPRI